MNLSDLLTPIDKIFKKHQIRYVVIGGYAVAAWGEERATRDVDLLCSGDSRVVVRALEEDHLRFEHRIGEFDDPISEVIRIEFGEDKDPFEIDVLIGIKGAPVGVFDRARILVIDELPIPVASPEDMILLKLLSGSARDLEDAGSIAQIQGEKLDWNIIKHLCPEPIKPLLEKLMN
jgi:hypothetical protein